MIETVSKTQRQAEFMRQHTLSPAQFKKLIAEKMERARTYNEAFIKREALLKSR